MKGRTVLMEMFDNAMRYETLVELLKGCKWSEVPFSDLRPEGEKYITRKLLDEVLDAELEKVREVK